MKKFAAAAALGLGLLAAPVHALDDGPYLELFAGYAHGGSNTHLGVDVDFGSTPVAGGRFGHMFSERWGLDFELSIQRPDVEVAGVSDKKTEWFLDAGAVFNANPDQDYDLLFPFGVSYGHASAAGEGDTRFGFFGGAALRWHPTQTQWYLRGDIRLRGHDWDFGGDSKWYLNSEASLAWGWAFGRP
jgi:hypothetical protein